MSNSCIVPLNPRLAGCRLIDDFVCRGGVYIGFCAGAYFAAKQVLFEPDTPIGIIHSWWRGPTFNKGKTFFQVLCILSLCIIGKSFGLINWYYHTKKHIYLETHFKR